MKKIPALSMYAGLVAVSGLTLFILLVVNGSRPLLVGTIHFWLLALAVVTGEFVGIKVPHREETLTVTLGDPFTLALLFSYGLVPAMIVKMAASLLEDANRRQPWWKAAFNMGQYALSLAGGWWMADLAGYSATLAESLTAGDILAAFAGGIVYFTINTAIVTTAISMAIGESPVTAYKLEVKMRVLQYGALLGYAPIVIESTHRSVALFPLLLIPMGVVYYNGIVTQKQVVLAQQLRELYESTLIADRKAGTRESIRELLGRVCNMFNASSSSLTLFPQEGEESSSRTTLDLDENSFTYMEPVELDLTQRPSALVITQDRGGLASGSTTNRRSKSDVEASGTGGGMISPLYSDEAVTGLIEVRNRRGPEPFTSEDLKLFETLANHASISLQNARLISRLEESLLHLTEMNRLKDDFVASVSHELRTPLTSIRGYVRTLLRPDVTFEAEQQKEFLETIDRQSTRLHRLIEDLLAVSRIESETDASVVSQVSMATLLDHVLDEIQTRVRSDQIEIEIEEGLPPVETDAGKVHQIVSNLIDNAIKYGGKDKPICVQARKEGEGVTISVTDRGPGVPPEMQDRIFERFYQVDQSATRSVGGAGLGLYICRRIAEAIGGRVWLEATGPEGSIFSLWIPANPNVNQTDLSSVATGSRAGWKM